MRSNCDSSIGSRLNISLKADLKRWPKLSDSALLCLEALRLRLEDFARWRDPSRDLLDMVPGNAVMAVWTWPGEAAEEEKVDELDKLSGGVGGAFGATYRDGGGAVFGAGGM